MICPACHAGCAIEDSFCQHCGADLLTPSKSLVPAQPRLPAVLQYPQLPRVAAGVGALAIGVGITLARRGLLTRLLRLARPARTPAKFLPALSPEGARELFTPSEQKPLKLPKGYAVHETMLYMSRVVRRED